MPISKNSENPNLIFQTDYWSVELSYKQCYLGRSVIISKREVEHLSELTSEEFLDLQKIIRRLEKATKQSFGATMFNWTCLMNGGYRQEPYKPFMHWHFRPRYNKKVEFEGKIFEDLDFGRHYDFKKEKELPEIDFDQDFRQKIIKAIQKAI